MDVNPFSQVCSITMDVNSFSHVCYITMDVDPFSQVCYITMDVNPFSQVCYITMDVNPFSQVYYITMDVNPFYQVCYETIWMFTSFSGVSVLTVIATDVDQGHNGTVTYSLKQVPVKDGMALFAINPNTGLITTTMNNALDRETQPEYKIIVQARDQGTPLAHSCMYHIFFYCGIKMYCLDFLCSV